MVELFSSDDASVVRCHVIPERDIADNKPEVVIHRTAYLTLEERCCLVTSSAVQLDPFD